MASVNIILLVFSAGLLVAVAGIIRAICLDVRGGHVSVDTQERTGSWKGVYLHTLPNQADKYEVSRQEQNLQRFLSTPAAQRIWESNCDN